MLLLKLVWESIPTHIVVETVQSEKLQINFFFLLLLLVFFYIYYLPIILCHFFQYLNKVFGVCFFFIVVMFPIFNVNK